jgi:hypothetical protein
LVALAPVAAGACYKTPKPNCTFTCGSGEACPTDYTCGPDNVCHLALGGGALAVCETPSFDASSPDGAVIDGAVIDGAVIDGPAIDAPQLDARPVDARPVDARPVDARPPDANVDANLCPALAIMSDGSGKQDLVISEIDPGGKLELYNPTGADINLATSSYALLSDPQFLLLNTLTGTVKTHGYFSLDLPGAFTDTTAGGEIILYNNIAITPGDFDAAANVYDFVCWGTSPHASHKATAEAASTPKWSGNCAGAITGTAIARQSNVAGTALADYDTAATASPLTCP